MWVKEMNATVPGCALERDVGRALRDGDGFDDLLVSMSGALLRLVDACRNNPLVRSHSWRRRIGEHGGHRAGLLEGLVARGFTGGPAGT